MLATISRGNTSNAFPPGGSAARDMETDSSPQTGPLSLSCSSRGWAAGTSKPGRRGQGTRGLAPRWAPEARGPREGGGREGHGLEDGPGVEILPNVLLSPAPPESHQLCDLDRVTVLSQTPKPPRPYLSNRKVNPFVVEMK